ncbi:RNA-directed DNA methylation 4 [Aristolochia californica]|uniref:RNA-directed DNA methylation 4 n=1 Tax=Aristolochia californica TaxID=171875 RepID=UPI0035DA0C58
MADVAESNSMLKPVVVRVKRKLTQAPLDALWLEINERPLKRALLDFENLSVSESAGNVDLKTKKVLVHHVETVISPEATKDALQLFVEPHLSDGNGFKKKIEERKHMFKQHNQKQGLLRSTARQKHEEHVKSARFEQIWKSRNRNKEAMYDDFINDFCSLYDVVRVDVEEEEASTSLQNYVNSTLDEDDAILCNYLPLIREYLPTAAAEIEADVIARSSKQDGYVYDLYTVSKALDSPGGDDLTMYPVVQVDVEDNYCCDGTVHSEFETDDSNAEDNPINDYPDEVATEDEEPESRSSNCETEDTEDGNAYYEGFSEEEEGEEEYWKLAHR